MIFKVARGATNLQTAYFDLAGPADETAAGQAAERLLAETGADVAEFDYVAQDSALFRAARASTSGGWARVEPKGRRALVDCSGQFEDWMATRGKSDRRHWPRNRRQLERLGVTFETVTKAADADTLAAELIEVEASGWKGAARSSIRDDPAHERFYTLLTGRAAAAGALHLTVLRHHGRAVAFDYGLIGAGRCLALKASYREEYKSYGIGHVASLRHISEMFAREDVRIYDTLGNGMTPHPYKVRFATHYQLFYRISLFARTARGLLLREQDRVRQAARSARDRVRPKPSFEPQL